MRKNFFALLFLLFSVTAFSQSKSKWSLGFSLSPTFCATVNTTSSSDKVNGTNQAYTAYNDSINGKETYRFNLLCPTFWFNYSLDQKWSLQTGLGYMDVGFQHLQNDIKLNDALYPGIGSGKLLELTNTSRNIKYDYRYQYLHVPVLFNYHVGKSGDYKFNYTLTGGIALDILLKHQMSANLDFDLDGKNQYNFDSTGYGSRVVALNIILGGRVDYKIDKTLTLMVQPVIGFYPFSVSSGPISVYPYYFSLNTGLVYEFAH